MLGREEPHYIDSRKSRASDLLLLRNFLEGLSIQKSLTRISFSVLIDILGFSIGNFMTDFEVGGATLGKIHGKKNDQKFFCYFTGFLEGIAASGNLEAGEVEPLIHQCCDFVSNIADGDANDIVEDFRADCLEFEQLTQTIEVRGELIDNACDRSATNRFMGFCAGIACDGVIKLEEAQKVVSFAKIWPSVFEDSFAKMILRECLDALEDGAISPEESTDICDAITQFIGDSYSDTGLSSLGGVAVFNPSKLPDDLEGVVFVLTGAFSVSPRREIEARIADFGGQVASNVSKKVNFVVIATEASRDWVTTHKGHKIIKAQKLQEMHGFPEFIEERELLVRLGY